jgi:hypothetical protein
MLQSCLLRRKEKGRWKRTDQATMSGLVSLPFSGKRGSRPEIERQIQAENDV